MTVSKYFDHITRSSEQGLYNSIIQECIQLTGIDVMYIPRDITMTDNVFVEPKGTIFREAVTIEMRMTTLAGWNGQGDMMSKFGLQVDNQAEFLVSRERFRAEVKNRRRPTEGDLVYIGNPENGNNGEGSFLNDLFEITWVTKEQAEFFWQTGDSFVYRFTAKLFTPAYEKFQTGLANVDQLGDATFVNEADMDPTADNVKLNIEELVTLDFDEKNPFGGL